MNLTAYLERINYHGALAPTAKTLRRLLAAHLFTVPFENLSIHCREPILLNDQSLFEKIVRRRRGGFCYEANGLFAALLREVGFDVAMLSAGVAKAEGGFGPDFDHMALRVNLDEPWLVDVGFGDSFREPLLLENRSEQPQGERDYRIDSDEKSLILMQREGGAGEEWKAQYRFTLQPYEYPDFEEMCRYHQTSPLSHFTKGRLCSMATPDGRVTLSEMRLIITRNGQRQDFELNSEEDFAAALRDYFNIILHP